MSKTMTYKHIQRIQKQFVQIVPYKTIDGWIRCAQTHRYFLDYNSKTLDQRIIDGETNKVEWQYRRTYE